MIRSEHAWCRRSSATSPLLSPAGSSNISIISTSCAGSSSSSVRAWMPTPSIPAWRPSREQMCKDRVRLALLEYAECFAGEVPRARRVQRVLGRVEDALQLPIGQVVRVEDVAQLLA